MWAVLEPNNVIKALQKLPRHIVEKYEIWKTVATNAGPTGLRSLGGARLEKLNKTQWSCRLSKGYRVIFEIYEGLIKIEVIDVGTHDVYKKMSPMRSVRQFENYQPARRHTRITPGIAIRSLREMQDITQEALAKATGLSQGAISNLEHDRVPLGLSRARALARALHVHPAVLLFP
jgi:DNA-binding XRE family transcriptional regulator/mRNA-degrading endonuclease RelE of RelBE toxin-antitoxin system